MDESVMRALARWPDVPAVYGWLALDRRGRWRLRGETIGNARANAFISRNYAADSRGRWFFQNGPQRVYVTLEYTPWIAFTGLGDGGLTSHTGLALREVRGAWIDEHGALVLATEHGAALVAERDLPAIAGEILDGAGQPCDEQHLEALRDGADPGLVLRWSARLVPVSALLSAQAPLRFGYDPEPTDSPSAEDDP